MPNYDDLFTGQTTQQEEKPFDGLGGAKAGGA